MALADLHPPFSSPLATPVRRPLARPLALLVLALGAGLLAADLGLAVPRTWTLPGLLALGLGLGWGWWRDGRLLLFPLGCFFALGAAMYGQAREPLLPPGHLVQLPVGEEVTMSGYVARPGKMGPERLGLVVAVEAWRSPGGWQPVQGLVWVSAPPQEPPPVGTRLVLRGKLHPPRRLHNPGAFDWPRHLAADGIFRTLRVGQTDDVVWLAGGELPWRERLRGGIRRLLGQLPPELRAMYQAMLLGDQGGVTAAMREAFSRTGTSHLLVISGLHLGTMAALAYAIVFWLLRRFPWLLLRVNAVKVATLAAAGPVVGYAWMAGGSPATQRAEVMVLAYLLLMFLGRPREVWSALALAALVILTLNPLRLFSASFTLSFAAVAGILYLMPLGEGDSSGKGENASGFAIRLSAWWRGGKQALGVSLAASLATAPLAAWYFNVVSLGGILVNLLAVPLVLGLALPLGEAAVLSQALGWEEGARWLLWAGQWPLWLGWQAIRQAAHLPGAAFFCPTPTVLQMALYVALLLFLFARPRRPSTLGAAALTGGALGLTILVPCWSAPGSVEITVLDSPAGLSALIVTPEGRPVALSAGWPTYPGREERRTGILPPYVHRRQFCHLTGVAGLSLTPSNSPELLEVAREFRVDLWWLPRSGEAGEAGLALRNFLGDRRVMTKHPEDGGPPWRVGEVEMHLIPCRGAAALQVEYQGRRVAFVPPEIQKSWEKLDLRGPGSLEAVVAPQAPPPVWMARQRPRRLILYGTEKAGGEENASVPVTFFSRKGAVTLILAPAGVAASQWRP